MQTQFESTTIESHAGHGGRGSAVPVPKWLSRLASGRARWVAWLLGVAVAWAAVVAYGSVESDGSAVPFVFFCLGITAVYYALLLVASRLGTVMRRKADEQKGRIDRSTTLYNRSGLIAHGDEMLAACRSRQRNLSLAVFDCSDLLEVHSIYGSRISRKLLDRIVRKLTSVAGEQGFAARTGPAEFTLVLPMGRDKARQAIRRVLGNPVRIELDAGDSEIVLVPEVVVQSAEPEMASVGVLYQSLCSDMANMKENEKRRQHYLTRERERHSRPMSLSFDQGETRPPAMPRALSRVAASPATMPMRLSAN